MKCLVSSFRRFGEDTIADADADAVVAVAVADTNVDAAEEDEKGEDEAGHNDDEMTMMRFVDERNDDGPVVFLSVRHCPCPCPCPCLCPSKLQTRIHNETPI